MSSLMRMNLGSGLSDATQVLCHATGIYPQLQKTSHLFSLRSASSALAPGRERVSISVSQTTGEHRRCGLECSSRKDNLTENAQALPVLANAHLPKCGELGFLKCLTTSDCGLWKRQILSSAYPVGSISSGHQPRLIGPQFVQVAHFGTSLLRSWSTGAQGSPGMFSRMWERIGFTGKLKYPKLKLRRSGLRLYLSCVELVDHDTFFKEFNLPDTFNSWFRITELHVWLALVRLAQEGKEGKFVRNNLVEFMWEDLDKRSRKLGSLASSTNRRKGLTDISEQFKAILFSYDEGALGDDMVLAGALWRNFFDSDLNNLEHLATLVEYVRKQLQHLDRLDSDVILGTGILTFLPLHGDEEDDARTKTILRTIIKRV